MRVNSWRDSLVLSIGFALTSKRNGNARESKPNPLKFRPFIVGRWRDLGSLETKLNKSPLRGPLPDAQHDKIPCQRYFVDTPISRTKLPSYGGVGEPQPNVARSVWGDELKWKANDAASLAVEYRTGCRRVIATQSAHRGSEAVRSDRREQFLAARGFEESPFNEQVILFAGDGNKIEC